jgi:excisionase family DNA binding protein
MNDLLTVAEACARLGVSQTTLYELMNAGQLGWTVQGRSRYFIPAELDRLAQERTVDPR